MIRLTNLADYAVILMCEMSHTDTRLSAQELSTRTGVPVPTVSKILNLLSRANLLVSHRGLKGGFALKGSADDINVADIIEVIDGPIALTLCSDGSNCGCDYNDICTLKPRWNLISGAVRGALQKISLAELAEPAIGGHVMKLREEIAAPQ